MSAIDPKTLFDHALQAFSIGDLNKAANDCLTLQESYPDNPHCLSLQAAVKLAQGVRADAIGLSQRAIELMPDDAAVQSNRAEFLVNLERFDEALNAAAKAISLDPNIGQAHASRGRALLYLSRFKEARDAFDQALQVDPSLAFIVKKDLVILAAAEGRYESAKQLANKIESNFGRDHSLARVRSLHVLQTLSVTPAEEMMRMEALWSTMSDKPQPLLQSDQKDWSRTGKIRIGYLSSDFKRHPVSDFLEPVLKHHDHSNFEIKLYDTTPDRDAFTKYMHSLADAVYDGANQSDPELARVIHKDSIDILVDLTGLHKSTRTGTFRYRPAPVQVSWIGYSGTSGMPEMDYVVADADVCPKVLNSAYTEQIIRMPDHYLCFAQPEDDIWPGRVPANANNFITFGSFNNSTKINVDVVRVWSQILNRVPNSRLHLKSSKFESQALREHFYKQFEAYGIDSDRIGIRRFIDRRQHFESYNSIDIALDPFPYCGTTTTLEALWMGVPVVTLVGDRWVQRTSYSFLKRLGLEEFCTYKESDYINAVCDLAANRESLVGLRETLRPKLLNSSICDAPRFTRNIEQAFSAMLEKAPFTKTLTF